MREGYAPTHRVSVDCRNALEGESEVFPLALTSPPYLNGTNYFRNTKLELWYLGMIQGEPDLRQLRRQAVCAGINNVTRARKVSGHFEEVESVVTHLTEHAGDPRIPMLVRLYFSDMAAVLESVYRLLRRRGRFVLDIGDSQFYGVHVPTDRLLCRIAEDVGFDIVASRTLAERRSRDKTPSARSSSCLGAREPLDNASDVARHLHR